MNTSTEQPTKVFVVEDSAPIRTRLAQMISALEGVALVGDAESPGSAILGITRAAPHIVVLDIHLLGGSGIGVLRTLRPLFPTVTFIMLTNFPNDQYRKACMESGANYFLDKNSEFEQVTRIIAGARAAIRCAQINHNGNRD